MINEKTYEKRITPAGAGKTILCRRVTVGYEDHPRRCGENLPDFKFTGDVKGSPPQVRGKPGWGDNIFDNYRITPAGAGKTVFIPVLLKLPQDHPRRCGEN